MNGEPDLPTDPLLDAYAAAMAAVPEEYRLAGGPILGPVPDVDDKLLARMSALNSLSLYRSATILAASGAYGHATALLVLAVEEFGKATAYRFYSLGIASKDPREEGRRPYIEERVLRCHECKQTVGFFAVLGRSVLPLAGYDEDWMERVAQVETSSLEKDPERLREVVPLLTGEAKERLIATLKADPELVGRLAKLRQEFLALNALKLSGFYVDRKHRVGHVPQEIAPETYELVRSQLVSVIDDSIPFVAGEPPAEIAAVMAKLKDLPIHPFVYKCPHRPARQVNAQSNVQPGRGEGRSRER
jgi:AbiV family abortive infection protein